MTSQGFQVDDIKASASEDDSEFSTDIVKEINGDVDLTSECPKVLSLLDILQELKMDEDVETLMATSCIETVDGGDGDTSDSWSTASESTWESMSMTEQPVAGEFKSAFQGLLANFLKERTCRERAEARLQQVENVLNENILTTVETLRFDVMRLSILLKEPNKAREEIHRSLSEKEDFNRLLEEKMFVLRNQCEQMREQLRDCATKRDILEKNNKEMAELLKKHLD